MVKAKYEEKMQKAKLQLQNVTAVSVTSDMWTSINMDAYLALSCHYIDENMCLKSVLGVVYFLEKHTAVKTSLMGDNIKGYVSCRWWCSQHDRLWQGTEAAPCHLCGSHFKSDCQEVSWFDPCAVRYYWNRVRAVIGLGPIFPQHYSHKGKEAGGIFREQHNCQSRFTDIIFHVCIICLLLLHFSQ